MTSPSLFQSPPRPCPVPRKPNNPNIESNRDISNKNRPATRSSGSGWTSITTSLYDATTKDVFSTVNTPAAYSTKKLTQQSLDICSEVLGSETGKGCSDFDTFATDSGGKTDRKSRVVVSSVGCVTLPRSCPPPLRSLAEGNMVRVRRCVEDGKLVLKGTFVPTSSFYLVAQRTDGVAEGPRLRIRSFPCSPSANSYSTVPVLAEAEEEHGEEEEEFEEGVSVEFDECKRRLNVACKEEEGMAAVAAMTGDGGRYRTSASC